MEEKACGFVADYSRSKDFQFLRDFLENEDPLTFTAGDLRGAIQLPTDVIAAGLQANPRTTDEVDNDAQQIKGQNPDLNKPNTAEVIRERIY